MNSVRCVARFDLLPPEMDQANRFVIVATLKITNTILKIMNSVRCVARFDLLPPEMDQANRSVTAVIIKTTISKTSETKISEDGKNH